MENAWTYKMCAMILLAFLFEYIHTYILPVYSKSSIITNQQAKVIYQVIKIVFFLSTDVSSY